MLSDARVDTALQSTDIHGDLDRAVDESQASDILRVSKSWLQKDRMRGSNAIGPPWIKIGFSVRYLRRDLIGYMRSCPGGGRRGEA